MSIIDTDTITHTRDLIGDTIGSGIDALPLDSLPDVSDVADTITHAASVAASKGSSGAVRVYRVASRTVRRHPKGVGVTVVAVLGLAGLLVWWSRRGSEKQQDTLRVADAA